MTTNGTVKRSTVDAMTERIRKSRPDISVDRAKKIAVDSAERLNRKRGAK